MGYGRGRASVGPVLFHPDYTVGSGVTPDLLTFRTWSESARGLGIAAFTAGGESHPALRTMRNPWSREDEHRAGRAAGQV